MRHEFPPQEQASSPIRQTLAASKLKVPLVNFFHAAHCYGSSFSDLVLASLGASIPLALSSLSCVLIPNIAEDKNFLLKSLANKFYLFYLPKTLISGRSFHSYLTHYTERVKIHCVSSSLLEVAMLRFSLLGSQQARPASYFILCLACFSSGVELDGGKLGDETLFSDKIVGLIQKSMTLRNLALDGIFRSSLYGRINEVSLSLNTPLHTMHLVLLLHLFLLSFVVSTHEVLLDVLDSIFI